MSPPAHGHDSLETMTQQDYSNDLVFRSNGEEYARIDGNGPWKQDPPAFALEVESTEIPCESTDLGVETPPASISFNTKDAGEIAKFTEEGFYYKGEFVDDAGEVHRLMKATLKDLLVVRNMPTDDDLDELALFWWGPDTDERTVSEVIEEGSMSAFARYVLTSYAHKNQ